MADWDKLQPSLGNLATPGPRAQTFSLGTPEEELTLKSCESLHDYLAALKQTADRNDGIDEAKKAKREMLTLALKLNGSSGILKDLIQLCEDAKEGKEI